MKVVFRVQNLISAVLIAACAFVIPALCQNKEERPSFAGAWTLEKMTSKLGTATVPSPRGVKIDLAIAFAGPELKLQEITTYLSGEKITNKSIYFTDGRGEIRLMPIFISWQGSSEGEKYYRANFTTNWKKQKLVSRGIAPIKNRIPVVEIIEEWELSEDGSELTHLIKETIMADPAIQKINSDINGRGDAALAPGLPFEVKYIFKKKPAE